MYCSSCGVAVSQGLTYCNYCGSKLNAAKGDDRRGEVKPELLVSAMVVCFVAGLIAITMLLGVMKSVINLNVGQILAFALLSFLILVSIEGALVRLLFRRKRDLAQADPEVHLKGPATNELAVAPARALPEPVPSVTEHTTRAFEPIYNERTSK
jgi:uncharacterized protein (DUF983 family)